MEKCADEGRSIPLHILDYQVYLELYYFILTQAKVHPLCVLKVEGHLERLLVTSEER